MNPITITDRIFATVTNCGRTIFRSSFDGMASLEDVVRAVSRAIGGTAAGMMTLMIRNGSQGWSVKRSLRLTSHSLPEATQLTLF